MKSIKKNFIWNSSYQLLLIIAPLVTIPHVSRVLGAEGVGGYSYTYSIAYYFVLFATLGMAQYGVRLIAQAGEDRELRSKSFYSAWAAQVMLATPIIILYFLYLMLSSTIEGLVGVLWGFWVVSAAIDVSWLYFGVEEFRMPTMRSFLTKVIGIIIILTFCKEETDLWAYVLGVSLPFFLNALMLLPFIKNYVDYYRPSWIEIKAHFLPNIRLFAPVIAMGVYMSFNKILLGNISGLEQTGYYEYADKIVKMPLSVVTALGTVMLPHMTAKFNCGDRVGALRLLDLSIWAVLVSAIGIMFGITAVSPELVPVFLGAGYGPCIYIIPMVALALPFLSASNVLGVQYLLPTCADKRYSGSVWCGAIVNVLSCLLFLKPFGAFGAAIATVLSEFSVLLFQCLSVRNELPVLSYVKQALIPILNGIVMLFSVRLISSILAPCVSQTILLIVEVFSSILIYLFLMLVWCKKRGRLEILIAVFNSR